MKNTVEKIAKENWYFKKVLLGKPKYLVGIPSMMAAPFPNLTLYRRIKKIRQLNGGKRR